MSGESVKVAVRVRPFNKREIDRNAKLIIEMQNAMTLIQDPDNPGNPPKEFTFDFSYWSHDGYVEGEDGYLSPQPSSKYGDQRKVFDDLGQGVLNNAFQGFNCSLFAYGQTGSGKSYSMVGYGNNKGIVPITCDELFKSIVKDTKGTKFEVMFSMLEIYNEQVRDLLTKDNPKGGLQVRQNPKENAFYVQGLKKVAVGSYEEIEKRTDEGTSNRTVAATNMNATSSRAHTVVTVQFNQIFKNEAGQETKKSSVINLVDLAGSERADSTGATGDRLKEGANINKSLSALGNVISALADLSMGKKKVLVPYRDSVLTKLLQNALGGNSKTIMIAALSPADINYDETLSTLRYADRAKKIKNKAVVNENPMDKLIRELREENEKLKTLLSGGGTITDEMKEQMRMNMEEMMTFDEKLEISRKEATTTDSAESEKVAKMKTVPHLVNLNEDPMLSGVIVYFLHPGENNVGQKTRDETAELDIALSGLSISKQHAVLSCKDNEITIKPTIRGAKTKVNGMPLTGERVIKHLDRILFGSNHMYYFENPTNTEKSEGSPDTIDWDTAQKEIAQAKGFQTGMASGLSKEQQVVQEQVLELLPLVSEVNAISEELDKHKSFEVILLSGAVQGNSGEGTKVVVKIKDLLNGNVWLWERGKFMNRRYLMQEMYQQYVDGEDVSATPKEEDPFWEPLEDTLVGTSNVFLQSLAYALDFDDKLAITDYKGNEEGTLLVNVSPCTQSGKSLDEDYFVDEPNDLIGKPYHFKINIRSAEINKTRYCNGLYVNYRSFNEDTDSQTEVLKNTLSPEFNHSRVISFPAITQDHLAWFESGCITFQMYAKQVESVNNESLSKMTTKELRQMDHINKPNIGPRSSTFAPNESSDTAKLKSELILYKRKNDRLLKKEKRIQELCDEWDKKSPEQQTYEAFHRAISAAAYHQTGRLKYRVNMIHSLIKAQQSANGGQIKTEDGSSMNTSRACILM